MWACVCVCSFFVVCATNGPKIDVHRNYIIPFPYPGLSDSVRGEKNRKNFFPFNFPKHQTTHQCVCVCVCVRLDFQLTSVTRNCSVPHRGEEQLFTNSFSQSRPRQSSIHCQNCYSVWAKISGANFWTPPELVLASEQALQWMQVAAIGLLGGKFFETHSQLSEIIHPSNIK